MSGLKSNQEDLVLDTNGEHDIIFKRNGVEVSRAGGIPLKTDEVIAWEAVNGVLTWAGGTYTDPDAVGANPTALIYPDGSIVGSTDNGNYTKYPNGELECHFDDLVEQAAVFEVAVSTLTFRVLKTISYPIVFTTSPLPTGSAVALQSPSQHAYCFLSHTRSITTSGSTLSVVVVASTAPDAISLLKWEVKGRWK